MKLALILGALAGGVTFSTGVAWQLAAIIGVAVAYAARPGPVNSPNYVIYQEEPPKRRWW